MSTYPAISLPEDGHRTTLIKDLSLLL